MHLQVVTSAGTFWCVCGRFLSSASVHDLASFFDTDEPEDALPPNYNVAPTQDVYAVLQRPDDTRILRVFEWGLIPSWAKDPSIANKLVNARGETVAEKPSFRQSFAKRRCIVPMNGFYEWKAGADDGPRNARGVPLKQPFLIERRDGEFLAVAGLWSAWRPPGAAEDTPWRHTCTVLTTVANATMAPVHDRMPVILEREDWDTWLDRSNTDTEMLQHLLVPADDHVLQMHPVSTDVNNARNPGPF